MTIINGKSFRALAIAILDDEEGTNEEAYNIMRDMLQETGNDDIANLVDATDGRFYLKEDAAKELRETIK